MIDMHTQKKGKKILAESKIIICSITRDCARNLIKNIKVVNELCDLSKEYFIIVFENDSKDNTKDVLRKWANERDNIYISLIDLNIGNTIPDSESTNSNPYYSKGRIEKMAMYRNQYMDYLDKMNVVGDFIIVVDLDVANINLDGIIHSFGQDREWDAISANGISLSPKISRRYHDTYALVESGFQNISQTEETIKNNQYRFSFLKKGLTLFQVFSAYGGLIIYRYEVVKGLRYIVLPNDDKRVEVRCEHFGLNIQIQNRGYNKFFINPNMIIKYQKLTFRLVYKTFLSKFTKYMTKI